MGKKILLVDDAAFMRLKLKTLLISLGHEIAGEAENGVAALEQYRLLKPDVVLMDITMPDMNGLEALKAIKKLDPEAVIVMVSAMGNQESVMEAVKSGARNFIVKPFDNERIRKVLDSL